MAFLSIETEIVQQSKIASSRTYQKKSKLAELASMIKGTADPIQSEPQSQLKGASYNVNNNDEKRRKLLELGKIIKGL